MQTSHVSTTPQIMCSMQFMQQSCAHSAVMPSPVHIESMQNSEPAQSGLIAQPLNSSMHGPVRAHCQQLAQSVDMLQSVGGPLSLDEVSAGIVVAAVVVVDVVVSELELSPSLELLESPPVSPSSPQPRSRSARHHVEICRMVGP